MSFFSLFPSVYLSNTWFYSVGLWQEPSEHSFPSEQTIQVHKPTGLFTTGSNPKRHRPDLKRATGRSEAAERSATDRSSSRGVGGLEVPKEANADRIELQGA